MMVERKEATMFFNTTRDIIIFNSTIDNSTLSQEKKNLYICLYLSQLISINFISYYRKVRVKKDDEFGFPKPQPSH